MKNNKTEILVIDGQGGRLGALICEKLKATLPDCALIAVGTNSAATAAMLKAGADAGATGEYPVIVNAARADFILAPVGAAIPASLCGEITPAMAEAVGRSRAPKFLIPGDKCEIHIVGTARRTLAEYADAAVRALSGAICADTQEDARQTLL